MLRKIEKELDKKNPNRSKIQDLSSQYYTLVPHNFGFSVPPAITTKKMLEKEQDLVEALSEIEIATKLLKSSKKDSKHGDLHPIDLHYNTLKCSMKAINLKKDAIGKTLVRYAK